MREGEREKKSEREKERGGKSERCRQLRIAHLPVARYQLPVRSSFAAELLR